MATHLHLPESSLTSTAPANPPAEPAAPQRQPGADRWFSLLLVAVYLALGLAGILHHEMWRDELHSWLLATHFSLQGMLSSTRYEGHPILWNLSLFGIGRFTHDPFAQQVFHLLIAAASVYLLGRYAPFSKLQKLLYMCGYFSLYEYGIISRCYALGTLVLFAFCTLLRNPNRPYLLLFSALSVMSNVTVYGTIIAISFALGLLLEYFIDARTGGKAKSRAQLLGGLAIFAVSLALAVLQMLPPSDGYKGDVHVAHRVSPHLKLAINSICIGYMPVPNFDLHFWSTSQFANVFPPSTKWVVCALGLFTIFSASLIKRPLSFFAYSCGTFGLVAFTCIFFHGTVRHYGQLFVLLVSCIWAAAYCRQWRLSGAMFDKCTNLFARCGTVLFTVLLIVQMIAGLFAFRMDLMESFSRCREVSNFIRQPHFRNLLVVGHPIYLAETLAGWNRKSIISLAGGWKERKVANPIANNADLCNRLEALAHKSGKDLLLVTNHRIKNINPRLLVWPLRSFERSIVADEGCYLYQVRLKPRLVARASNSTL